MYDVFADQGVMNDEGEYGKFVVQKLTLPATHARPEVLAAYAKFGKRIHWLDANMIPGAFQMNTSWYLKPNAFHDDGTPNPAAAVAPHKHTADEIIGFYGTNPDEPYDLGGEIVFYIGGEKHVFTRSTMLFIPAGLEHAPLVIMRVDRPIFHFSVVTEGTYRTETPNGTVFEAK